MSIFSDNLKRFRLLAGFSSMKALADAAGLVYNTYLSYETKDVEPKYSILCKLADLLHVTTDALLGHTLDSPDPYMMKLREAGAAAASAAATSLGMSLAPDDLRFEKLRKQMADIGFFITRNTEASPDPKYGTRVDIVFDFGGKTHRTYDYYHRMYLLASRLMQSAEHRAFETFYRQMLMLYGGLERQPFDSYDLDSFDLQRYEHMFESLVASKTPEEIRAIVEGRAENPLTSYSPSKTSK